MGPHRAILVTVLLASALSSGCIGAAIGTVEGTVQMSRVSMGWPDAAPFATEDGR